MVYDLWDSCLFRFDGRDDHDYTEYKVDWLGFFKNGDDDGDKHHGNYGFDGDNLEARQSVLAC